ncbi:MAG: isocitrate/isopropylmalate family dehydrogenase [Bacteroidales bacterium]|jgi:isocitrate dehydrogenase (NAD+)
MNSIEKAKIHFESLLRKQLERVESMASSTQPVNYNELDKIVIGVVGGDGIGPSITAQAQRLLEYMLTDSVKEGRVEIHNIDGLTIENRAKEKQGIPSQVLQDIKKCNVILKGPTTTPRAGDAWPNIESANVAMRRELDLFANVRPVQVPDQGIDWVFFTRILKGLTQLGTKGLQ